MRRALVSCALVTALATLMGVGTVTEAAPSAAHVIRPMRQTTQPTEPVDPAMVAMAEGQSVTAGEDSYSAGVFQLWASNGKVLQCNEQTLRTIACVTLS